MPLGRPMREYVLVPRDMHEGDDELAQWVGRALAFVAAMPPKVKKPKAARTPHSDA